MINKVIVLNKLTQQFYVIFTPCAHSMEINEFDIPDECPKCEAEFKRMESFLNKVVIK